jgi:hypothetical protein
MARVRYIGFNISAKSISSAEPNYFVHFAMRCPVGKVSVKTTIHILYIRTVTPKVFFRFGKFNSLLAGLGRNQVYSECT